MLAMAAMIMCADGKAPFDSGRGKPGVAAGMFAKPVENLDDNPGSAFWLPSLYMYVMAVRGGQNLCVVM